MPGRFALLAISSLMLLPGCGEATESVGPEVAKLLDGKWLKGSAADPKLKQTVGLQDKADSDEGTLYVANADKAYPLLVVPDPGSDSQGRARFSNWDEKVTVSAPPAAQVVDVDKLAS